MESRLKNYALTAGGAVTLATAGAANAEIISSDASMSIILNENPVILFSIGNRDIKVSNSTYSNITYGGASARMRIDANFDPYAGALGNVAYGSSIGSYGIGGDEVSAIWNYRGFSNGTTAFSGSDLSLGDSMIVGMIIAENSSNHYAWVNYSLSWNGSEYTFTINSWAYNDVAGQGIIAGQNVAAGSNAVPGLGGLAALAMGAAGVRSRRQRTVA
ncbi:MAG: hypothetical protein GY911_08725 [Actinomycetales bacterium]|nr:hypothetical protein [Actinomycetales bacterium]